MTCTIFSLTMRRAVLDEFATGFTLCLETQVRVAAMSHLFLSTATWGSSLRYCSQADANEAAPAHIAAQTPSDDNSATINTASLVKVTAASHRLRPVRDGRCGSWRSSTEYVCSDTKSRSTSSSLRSRPGAVSRWPVRTIRHLDCHQNARTLTTIQSTRRLLHVKKLSAMLF